MTAAPVGKALSVGSPRTRGERRASAFWVTVVPGGWGWGWLTHFPCSASCPCPHCVGLEGGQGLGDLGRCLGNA